MNDYMFTIDIYYSCTNTQKYPERRNVVVSAENVEVAFDEAMKKVTNDTDVFRRELVDVKKL